MAANMSLEVNVGLVLKTSRDKVESIELRFTPYNPDHRDKRVRAVMRIASEPQGSAEVVDRGRLNASVPGQETSGEPRTLEEPRKQLIRQYPGAAAAWIFQSRSELWNLRSAVRTLEEMVWIVRQFKDKISPGDSVYLWVSGPRGGILGVAEVVEMPRIQPEPAAQLRFFRDTEKFTGDELRVKLRLRKRIDPLIPRSYLLSRPELANLSILRCPRGTNFRVSRQEAESLEALVGRHMASRLVPGLAGTEKRVVFAEG